MAQDSPYFLCGIGGSGMLPLALILRAQGADVAGSDRTRDQGGAAEKFAFLERRGIRLFPQDGSGVTSPAQIVVTSTAVEETVPDVAAAKRVGATRVTRAELLARLFNAADPAIGIAGTSGKSTTTGMIGWIFSSAGRDPTVMNGAVMKNFVSARMPFASALVGHSTLFVSEVDESDGSIALYAPDIAVVNNVALDHKSMDELRQLFADFVAKARIAILNLDNAESAALARCAARISTFSLGDPDADFLAREIVPARDGIAFRLYAHGVELPVTLRVPGRHNVANALAAVAATVAAGVSVDDAAAALQTFDGIRRRLETVGTAGDIAVIDDFAHNPDKIAATLATLHDFPGRLLVFFQPHGYGPLKKMQNEFVDIFASKLRVEDILVMPDPAYFGGTVDRSIGSADIAEAVTAKGRRAFALGTREACKEKLLADARPGDRIVVMGARDDSLSTFAEDLVGALRARRSAATDSDSA